MLKKHRGHIYIAGLFVFLVAHHLFAYQGHFGFDDMLYARFADNVADGNFELTTDHFTYRWVPVFLTGIAYKLMGVTDHASAVMPLLTTCFIILLIFFLYRKQQGIAILAVTFYALYYWTLYYSDKIMPDVYVATAAFTALFTVHHHRFRARGRHTILYAALFSMSIFIGFLAKETILFMIPVAGVIFVSDIFQKQFSRFWIYSAGMMVLLLAGYFTGIYLLTGNAFSRLDAISAGSYLNPCSYDVLHVSVLLKRIAYQLWLVFTNEGLAVGILFCLPSLEMGFKKLAVMKDERAFWTTLSFAGLLAANFMTTSYKGYVPMCPEPRHFLYLVPIIAVAAAPVTFEYLFNGRFKVFIFFGAAALFTVAYYNGSDFTYYTYLPFLIFTLLRLVGALYAPATYLPFYILFMMVLYTPSLFAWERSKKINYFTQKEVVEQYFAGKKEKNIVITDKIQGNMGEYYLEFDSTYTRFVFFEEAANYPFSEEEDIYLLMNDYIRYFSDLPYDKLPEYAKHPPASAEKVYDYNGVVLYKLRPSDFVK